MELNEGKSAEVRVNWTCPVEIHSAKGKVSDVEKGFRGEWGESVNIDDRTKLREGLGVKVDSCE